MILEIKKIIGKITKLMKPIHSQSIKSCRNKPIGTKSNKKQPKDLIFYQKSFNINKIICIIPKDSDEWRLRAEHARDWYIRIAKIKWDNFVILPITKVDDVRKFLANIKVSKRSSKPVSYEFFWLFHGNDTDLTESEVLEESKIIINRRDLYDIINEFGRRLNQRSDMYDKVSVVGTECYGHMVDKRIYQTFLHIETLATREYPQTIICKYSHLSLEVFLLKREIEKYL